MAWVWYDRFDTTFEPADVDAKSPIHPADIFSLIRATPPIATPIFRIGTTLAKFERFHCPPVLATPVVDVEWRRIILDYVPEDLIQFWPIKVVCRDGVSEKYSMLMVFAQVRCIDPGRSDIISAKQIEEIILIFSCARYVHHEDCLRGYHLARDEQKSSHLVLSDELRNALAATGESAMFYRPEDLPL